MKQKRITEEAIQAFRQYLIRDEKSAVTVEKYLRDVRAFQAFIGETPVEKELVIHYKNHLLEESYAVRSINSMLASVNSFLIFMDWPDCKVKSLKVQRQVYCAEEKELTKAEYERLLKAAGKNEQLRLVMETICSTGIRVSELKYFTAEAVRRGEVIVRCKAKTRYRQQEEWATVTPLADGKIQVTFDEPQRAMTVGQAVVLYDGDTVLGGGTILREEPVR